MFIVLTALGFTQSRVVFSRPPRCFFDQGLIVKPEEPNFRTAVSEYYFLFSYSFSKIHAISIEFTLNPM